MTTHGSGSGSHQGLGPGAVIAQRYQLLERLGAGAMGAVYRAQDLRSGVTVALKLTHFNPSARQHERAQREAEALRRLDHPALVSAWDHGRDGGFDYLVMELVEGRPLSELLGREELPWWRAVEIARALAEGLAHAHQLGILHRDVKPDNVLLRPDGSPVLVDFGLAGGEVGAQSLTQTGQAMGTPGYMPPEQALGDRARVGVASDVYGLGATLYALLTGTPPFEYSNLSELAALLRTDPAPPSAVRSGLPAALDAVCMRCLAREPAARYPSALELVAALQAAREGTGESRRAAPRLAAAAAAVAAVSVALTGYVLWGRAEPAAPTHGSAGDVEADVQADPLEALVEQIPADPVGARAKIQAYLREQPDSARSWVILARVESQEGEYEAQLAAVQRALELDPHSAEGRYLLGEALLWLRDDYPGAERELTAAIEGGMEEARVYNLRAFTRMAQDENEEARVDLDRALELDSDYGSAHVNLSHLSRIAGRYDEALGYAERGLACPDQEGSHTVARYSRAQVYFVQGRLSEALEELDQVVREQPEDSAYRALRMHLNTLSGRYTDALVDAEWLEERGKLEEVVGPEPILENLRRRLKVADAEAWVHLGRSSRQPSFAHGDFTRALELDPTLAEVRHWRFSTREAMELYPAALADLDVIERQGGEDPGWGDFARGGILLRMGELDRAVEFLARSADLRPHPTTLTNLCVGLDRLGRHQEAVEAAEQALALAPDHWQALTNMANALAALGRHQEALSAYDRALELAPGDPTTLAGRQEVLQALAGGQR